jgi:hypothetical protein
MLTTKQPTELENTMKAATKTQMLETALADARFENERAEVLWKTLERFLLNGAAGRATISRDEVYEVLNKNARCSCGRHAGMYQEGRGPKVCETCMST